MPGKRLRRALGFALRSKGMLRCSTGWRVGEFSLGRDCEMRAERPGRVDLKLNEKSG